MFSQRQLIIDYQLTLTSRFDDAVIVGIGVNVNAIPEGVDQPTTGVKALMNRDNTDVDVTEVFHAVLKSFWQAYRSWLAHGFEAIKTEWLSHAYGLNTRMTTGGHSGIFTSISDEGALLLTTEDGVVHSIVTV